MSKKTLFETLLTEYASTDVEGIGSERQDQYGNTYKWVYNASAFAARAGGPACYDASNYSSENFMKHVIIGAAEDLSFFAGVFMSAIPTLNYGWIMKDGRYAGANVAVATGGSVGTGDPIVPSTLTDTTGTGAARAYSFINGVDGSQGIGTGAGTAYTPAQIFNPCALMIEAVVTATGVTGTTPQSCYVFVKGL